MYGAAHPRYKMRRHIASWAAKSLPPLVARPIAFLAWAVRRQCRLCSGRADSALDTLRHENTGIFLWMCGKLGDNAAYVCDLTNQSDEHVCVVQVGFVRIAQGMMLAVQLLTLCWAARTRLLQSSLPRLSLLLSCIQIFAGLPIAAVITGITNVTVSFLLAWAYSVALPGSVLVLMLWEDSSRVDALTQFLQYMSHQVRGPSTSAGLALRLVHDELQQMRELFKHIPTDVQSAFAPALHAPKERGWRVPRGKVRSSRRQRSLGGARRSRSLPLLGSASPVPAQRLLSGDEAGKGGSRPVRAVAKPAAPSQPRPTVHIGDSCAESVALPPWGASPGSPPLQGSNPLVLPWGTGLALPIVRLQKDKPRANKPASTSNIDGALKVTPSPQSLHALGPPVQW